MISLANGGTLSELELRVLYMSGGHENLFSISARVRPNNIMEIKHSKFVLKLLSN